MHEIMCQTVQTLSMANPYPQWERYELRIKHHARKVFNQSSLLYKNTSSQSDVITLNHSEKNIVKLSLFAKLKQQSYLVRFRRGSWFRLEQVCYYVLYVT